MKRLPESGALKGCILILLGVCQAALAPDPAEGSNLFGLLSTGEFYVSTNHGVTWSPRAALPVKDAVALRAETTSLRLFMASRAGGIYFSSDAGLNWSAVGSIAASDVADLAFRSDGNLLALTERGSLYLSEDGGVSFTPLAALTASNHVSLTSRADGDLFVLTETGEVSASTDLGESWTACGVITVSDAVEIRAVESALFVMTGSGWAWRSSDDGSTWTPIGVTNQLGVSGLAVDEGTLVAATREGHVYTSPTGVTWTPVGTMNQLELTALADDAPSVSGVGPATPVAPRLTLLPPWPNPWRAGAAITFAFTMTGAGSIALEIFDVAGRLVESRPPRPVDAGEGPARHEITWNPDALPSGTYFARVSTDAGVAAWAPITIVR